jgi:hypothetical protein
VRNASTGVKLAVDGDKVVVWTSLAAAPNRPSDLFMGPVSLNASGNYTYPAFNEDLYTTHAAFSAAFKEVMGSKDPAIGVA